MGLISKLKRIILKHINRIVVVNVNQLPSNDRFLNKTVLVTGGSSGIGLEIAKQFIEEGARVIITGRNENRLREVARNFGNENLITYVWDVSDISNIERKFSDLITKVGTVDIFVNNAGVYESTPWKMIDEGEYDRVNNTNCKGLFFMCQKEGDYFLTNGIRGRIVNICSAAGLQSGYNTYSVSKWGSVCITKGLAKMLAVNGIVVNGVAPGNVVTNIHDGFLNKNIKEDAYCPSHLTERFTLVEEVASLVLYLSSDVSTNIIGQIIAIDGGMSLN